MYNYLKATLTLLMPHPPTIKLTGLSDSGYWKPATRLWARCDFVVVYRILWFQVKDHITYQIEKKANVIKLIQTLSILLQFTSESLPSWEQSDKELLKKHRTMAAIILFLFSLNLPLLQPFCLRAPKRKCVTNTNRKSLRRRQDKAITFRELQYCFKLLKTYIFW